MEEARNREAAISSTLAVLDKTLNKTEVEAMASVNSAYVMCSAECGPMLQYLGAGYYVKRAPMTIKRLLEKELEAAKQEQKKATPEEPLPAKPQESTIRDDTIEIIERYDSSDE